MIFALLSFCSLTYCIASATCIICARLENRDLNPVLAWEKDAVGVLIGENEYINIDKPQQIKAIYKAKWYVRINDAHLSRNFWLPDVEGTPIIQENPKKRTC